MEVRESAQHFESGGDVHGWINAAMTGMSWSGKAQAPYFLLLAQKKVGKENGTLLPRPSGSLRFSSVTGVRQLASLKHGSLEPCH
ncbi:MAG: hypothetical protein P8Z31_10785 [Gammaproteobacteria bacterium]